MLPLKFCLVAVTLVKSSPPGSPYLEANPFVELYVDTVLMTKKLLPVVDASDSLVSPNR